MNKFKAFLYHLRIEFLIGFRNKSIFFINYFLPLFFYAMMGFIMIKINKSFNEYMVVSMILFAIMTSTLLTVPNEVVFSRAKGVFRSYKIYGITKFEIVLHYTLNSMMHCSIASIIIFFTAVPLFGAKPVPSIPLMVLSFVLFFLANMGICLLISMLFSIPKVAGLIAQAVFIPSILAGGIIIPLNVMPKEILNVIKVLPSTYVMNIFQLKSREVKISAINCTVQQSIFILIIFVVFTYALSLIKFKYNNR